jgi:hypothetical protein
LSTSFDVLTQAPPHSVVPPEQFTPQEPVEQTWLTSHEWPHVPQLAGSLASSTQALPQRLVPPPQDGAHWPPEHS